MLVRKLNLLNMFLAMLCLFFVAKIYGVWSEQSSPTVLTRSRAEKATPVELNPQASEADPGERAGTVDFILDHDLFQEDRKRPLPMTADRLPPPVLNAALHGIFQDEEGSRVLLQDISGPNTKPRWLTLGDSIGDFKVTKIEKDRVELEARDTKKVLVVFNNARPKPPVPPTSTQPGSRPQAARASVTAPPQSLSQRESLLNRIREARRRAQRVRQPRNAGQGDPAGTKPQD